MIEEKPIVKVEAGQKRLFRRRLIFSTGIVMLLSPGRRATQADTGAITQPKTLDESTLIERAYEMRDRAVESGDQGYGAIIVCGGRIVGQAPSRVIKHSDPTAHAEMEAIRDAARRLGARDLSRCTLYSSSRPCPMCESAAYWAGIARMVHGRDLHDARAPALCR